MSQRCPRCQASAMRSWAELTDEEQEVVKRLPETVGYTQKERESSHRWCTRCWHEEVVSEERRA